MKAKRKTDVIIQGEYQGRLIYLKEYSAKGASPTITWSEDKEKAMRFPGMRAAREYIQDKKVHRETVLIRVPAEG